MHNEMINNKGDYDIYDKLIAKYARAVLRGKASGMKTDEEGNVTYKAWSNKRVFAELRIVNCEKEVNVRILKWIQEITARPEMHKQLRAAIFGRMKGERPAFNEDGSLTEHATPWAWQMWRAMASLDEIEDGRMVLEELNGSFRDLFEPNSTAAEMLQCIDMSQMRAVTWASAIPPPGFAQQAVHEADRRGGGGSRETVSMQHRKLRPLIRNARGILRTSAIVSRLWSLPFAVDSDITMLLVQIMVLHSQDSMRSCSSILSTSSMRHRSRSHSTAATRSISTRLPT